MKNPSIHENVNENISAVEQLVSNIVSQKKGERENLNNLRCPRM